MSSMYASSSSQKTCFLSSRNPPTRSLSSRDVIAQPPPAGPVQQPHAVLLDERVLVRPDWWRMREAEVVRIVLEVGREEPDRRGAAERVEQHRVPARGRVHDVVVELDEVRRVVRRNASGIGVLPDVLSRCERRGSADRRASRDTRRVSSVDALFQITISRVAVGRSEEHVLDALLEQMDAVVRQDDDGDRRRLRRARQPASMLRGFHCRDRRNGVLGASTVVRPGLPARAAT